MRPFSIMTLAALAAALAMPAAGFAREDATPAGQVYAVTFGDSPPVSGMTVIYTFHASSVISSEAPRGLDGFDGYGEPGGSGRWYASGFVEIIIDCFANIKEVFEFIVILVPQCLLCLLPSWMVFLHRQSLAVHNNSQRVIS